MNRAERKRQKKMVKNLSQPAVAQEAVAMQTVREIVEQAVVFQQQGQLERALDCCQKVFLPYSQTTWWPTC